LGDVSATAFGGTGDGRLTSSRVIVALDFAEAESALALVNRITPEQCKLKIGKELFTAAGPSLVETLVGRGFEVFLDLKFHDIPTTVARACRAAAQLGVWMINVHALGGGTMIAAARDALGTLANRPLLIAVTILTSMDENDLAEIGITARPHEAATRLAALARKHGADGVVCSAHEAASIRAQFGEAFLRVTPGIRLAENNTDDQKRVMTPSLAVHNGASYLVIGRPVTRADDPAAVLRRIEVELQESGALE
jgi:orotidine-5'-phosphate decarboxylase